MNFEEVHTDFQRSEGDEEEFRLSIFDFFLSMKSRLQEIATEFLIPSLGVFKNEKYHEMFMPTKFDYINALDSKS